MAEGEERRVAEGEERRVAEGEERRVAEGEEMDCDDKIISISGKKVMEKDGKSQWEVNVVDRVIENDIN